MTGIALAGGMSRRLGRNKALEPLGGKTLLQRVLDVLEEICDEVLVVTVPGRALPPLWGKVRLVTDTFPGRGPLAGLHAGLTQARTPYSWAVACDMPFLNPGLLLYLASLAQGYDAVVPVVSGMYQVLHTVYSKGCLPALEKAIQREGASLHHLLPMVRVRFVEEPELRTWDPELRSFININTQSDLEQARKLLEGSQ